MSVLKRNNVTITGNGENVMLFAHGFGCDQNMWRYVSPAFQDNYTTVLFDHVGAGNSDLSSYSFEKYDELEGYAQDIVEIANELNLKNVVFVGHSVSALMGLIAAKIKPDLFKSLVLVSPSPSYINQDDYVGGFSRSEIEELLESLNKNHLGWSATMAPVIMGNPDRKDLNEELTNSFCKTDPEIAKHFARTTFLSDKRDILPETNIPVAILQCSNDVIAPVEVGNYMHQQIPESKLVIMNATGHCPNLSAPEETIAAIRNFLND
ncbi:alpha/beta hydrolase [Chryseobacterium wangxinyae]|uniref:alpha/beta fold hydrolase n=1 Tax=Chryseobacterium sp. CY350 TaxID=2997336 RepID=UPI0022721C72|nr:alpha/beta hydrolase [Chryseobacterium sp. CY350]MCY0976763.1 alpha/beta hydrolase [Chryseobacterium sp. CY350]WBZ96764.1 alpha/beta hydrolase [Chryseobacterium sp. CY350]